MRDVPLTSQSLDPLTFGEESVRGAGHRIRPGLDSSSTGHCATVVGNRKKSNGKSWLKSVQRIRYESDFPLYFLSASAHIGSVTVRRPYAAALEWLRAAGLRLTRQRLALTRLLFAGTDRHVTVNALHKEARANNVRVTLATVYNTLNQFTEAGLLREVVVDASCTYFDTNASHHHHFFCEEDRYLVDIPGEELKVAKHPHPPPERRSRR